MRTGNVKSRDSGLGGSADSGGQARKLVAGNGLPSPEPRIPSPGNDRQLRADDPFQAGTLRGNVKARCAVDAVAIEQSDRWIAERRGAFHERFRQRCAVEEREC